MAERCRRPELRLHVQVVDHRQQQRGQNVIPLPVRGRLLHVGFCVYRWHRLQGQDSFPTRQKGQATDMGM